MKITPYILIALGALLGATAAKAETNYVDDRGMSYETVAASQTDQLMGSANAAAGDYLDRIIITVNTAATAAVSIEDGNTNIPILPNSPGGGVGVYVVEIKATSTAGGWEITTGAGSTVLAVGRFK